MSQLTRRFMTLGGFAILVIALACIILALQAPAHAEQLYRQNADGSYSPVQVQPAAPPAPAYLAPQPQVIYVVPRSYYYPPGPFFIIGRCHHRCW